MAFGSSIISAFVNRAASSNGLIGKVVRGFNLVLRGTGYDWKKEAGDPQANLTLSIGMQTIIDKLQQSTVLGVKQVKGSDLPIVDQVQTDGFAKLVSAGGCTMQAFITILACSCKLSGPAFVVAERDGNEIKSLTPFLSSQVTMNGDGVRYDIRRHGDNQLQTIDPENVIPIMYGIPDPSYPLWTMSPVNAAYRQIVGDNEAATFMASVLKNMGIISYLISPKGDNSGLKAFSKEQRKAHEEKVRTMTMDKRGGVYASPEPVDFHKLGMSPDELSVSDYKRLLIVELLGALGVDPMVCSMPSDNRTYNNYAEARTALVEDTIMPLWATILRPITEFLIANKFLAPGVSLVPDKSKYPEMDEDKDKKATRAQNNFKALLTTRGEARVEAGIVEKPDDPRLYSEIMAELRASATANATKSREYPITERQRRTAQILREIEAANN